MASGGRVIEQAIKMKHTRDWGYFLSSRVLLKIARDLQLLRCHNRDHNIEVHFKKGRENQMRKS